MLLVTACVVGAVYWRLDDREAVFEEHAAVDPPGTIASSPTSGRGHRASTGHPTEIESLPEAPPADGAGVEKRAGSREVLPSMDPQLAYRAKGLRNAHERFMKKRNVDTAGMLLQKAIIAWSEHAGTIFHQSAEDHGPEQILSETQWTMSVSDQFGGHLIIFSRTEFPEWWELRDYEIGKRREMFDLSLEPEILARVEARALTVLALVEGP